MKLFASLFLVACASFATVNNVRVLGTTATQATVAYTAPDGSACSTAVSQTADTQGNPIAPLAHDIDPAVFPGANLDSRAGNIVMGQARLFLIGKRDAEKGQDGRYYSRALQAYTTYYGAITCGSSTALFTFQTSNVPLGIGYADPWPADVTNPGAWAAPSSPGSIVNEQFVEPQTGLRVQHLTYPGFGYQGYPNNAFSTAYNQNQNPCDSAGPWLSPCNAVGSSGYASATNSTSWLVLRPNNISFGWGGTDPTYGYSLNQLQVGLKGHCGSSNASLCQVDVCLTMNAGASCATAIQTITLPPTTDAVVTAGTYNPGSMGIDPWLFDSNPKISRPDASTHQGQVTVSGSTLTVTNGDWFNSSWTAGGQGRIRLSNVSKTDACAAPPATNTSIEAAISSGFGSTLTVTAAPGSYAYYCAPAFGAMIRRHTPDSGSSIYVQAATYSYVSSQPGEWLDQGFTDICSNVAVGGGYQCMLPVGGGGVALVWINPSSGTANMIGPASANAKSTGTDQWSTSNCPLFAPEAYQTIDDTKSAPTWYCVATSGGKQVILQVTYTGPYSTVNRVFANGDGIGTGSATASDNYSITFANAVITDLTPTSLGKDLVSLINTYIGANIDQYYGQSGDKAMTCANGPVQQGNMLVYCYRGQDTMAWLAVFSPGDGIPAHAGQPGGPNVIAAMSTWGHGASRWSNDHSTQDYGHSGYFGYGADSIGPGTAGEGATVSIVTTNTALTNVGSDCSTWGNPMGVTGNNCILLLINANSGSYEPYYWASVPPQQQTPGELSTAQVGDIFCISESASSCNWLAPTNEILMLIQKGANGQWVFKRNAGHWTVGPFALNDSNTKYLLAMSTATNLSYYDATYTNYYSIGWGGNVLWDYRNDPNGLNPVIDPGFFDAHGYQRQTSSVEAGNYPYSPWSGVYRVRRSANFSQLFTTPAQYATANPAFAGLQGPASTNIWQSHPSGSGDNATPNEGQAAFDVRPLVGVQTTAPSSPFTAVSGQLWMNTYSVTDADDIGSLNRKVFATAASSGPHPLADVSGPASSISDQPSSSYQYCVVRIAGECRSGSVAGQVYVNAPGIVYPWCYGNPVSGQGNPQVNDICLSNSPPAGQGLIQFSTLQSDQLGQLQRILVRPMNGKLKYTSGFGNARVLPDNSWVLFQGNYLDSLSRSNFMALLPSFPPSDSVARGALEPVTVSVRPPAGMGVNNAVIQFGYLEYAQAGVPYCTSRLDGCFANAATVPSGTTPFLYASENPSGLPCASGCSIAIPAIAQRQLFYRIQYRNASNALISATPWHTVATP